MVINEGFGAAVNRLLGSIAGSIGGGVVGGLTGFAIASALGLVFPPAYIGLIALPLTAMGGIIGIVKGAEVGHALTVKAQTTPEKMLVKLMKVTTDRDVVLNRIAQAHNSGENTSKLERDLEALSKAQVKAGMNYRSAVEKAEAEGKLFGDELKVAKALIEPAVQGKLTLMKK